MAEQEPANASAPVSPTRSQAGKRSAHDTKGATPEVAAAIVAVVALTQAEALPEAEPPRASAWARAGRREAVRAWTKPE
jgi:hypothetical protein